MAKILRISLLSMSLLFAAASVMADDYTDDAQAILAGHFDGEGAGAAVAVLQHGQVLVNTAVGYADIDAEVPISATTLFDLASVSKHFTALAALKLASTGALDVRLPVTQYLPDFELESPGRPIRVADLIYHVSGLPDYSSSQWEGTDAEFARLTNEDHLVWLNEQTQDEEPGTVYRYNNSGYVLLALIVERVSGQRFADYLSAQLLRPAGMRSTQVMDDYRARFRGQARGYKQDDDDGYVPSTSPSSITGDGNVYTNITDMIAWMRALDGNGILSAAQKRRAWTTGKLDSGAPLRDEDGSGYGYGWVTESGGRVSHSGSWMGTATYVLRDSASDASVVVLSNDEDANVSGIAEALLELVE